MRTDGIGTLLVILQRSRLTIILLVVIGIVQMNIIRHAQGPAYTAHAQVVLSPTDLATALAGLSTYVDPTLVDQTEQALATSPQLFHYAAQRNGSFGSPTKIQSLTSASKNGSTISFTTTASSPGAAVGVVNLVARSYPAWRASIASAAIDQAMAQLHAQGPNPDTAGQLDKLRLLKTLTSGNVLLVETADSAVKTRPKLITDSLLGAFIGLFIALIIVAIREALDSRVRTEEEVENALTVPVLGTIEKLPRTVSLVISGRDAERFGDMYALLAASIVQHSGDGPVTIAVTSAMPGEGKTTTAINLAAALARRNARVKLIDLDMRRPSLGRVLKLPADALGAEQVILGRGTLPSLLWDVSMNGSGTKVQRANLARRAGKATSTLQVLPMKSSSLHSLAGLGDKIRALLKVASEGADYVVIDTPPALSTPDVTELAGIVDMVLFVVRHGVVSRRNLEALHRLQRTWPQVDAQAVMVGVPTDVHSYSYYPTA